MTGHSGLTATPRRQRRARVVEPPAYFEPIRDAASKRWQQLEADPDLAAPWHQLFRQVQSPRHVLSELLQNADDAGATEASADIRDGVFSFTHNGRDFTEEDFRSLCRFGYSGKRVLHTIGFRGVGFKSTFSLGDVVELRTPTLAVAFDSERFTEPRWIERNVEARADTTVRIQITDSAREDQLRANLDAWLANPLSLLFFRNVARLRIGEYTIGWNRVGPGPVRRSEWVERDGVSADRLLRIQSTPRRLPEGAVQEIRNERMLSEEESLSLPPVTVELVVGAAGRIYVVLPTEVEVRLPFSCNAPFVQDPARDRLKEPSLSLTNRWLLTQIGELAATALLEWAGNTNLKLEERAQAYELLPSGEPGSDSLADHCRTEIESSFFKTIEGRRVVLTEQGKLAEPDESILLPPPLVAAWPPARVTELFDDWWQERPPVTRFVTSTARTLLARHELTEEISDAQIFARLCDKEVPKPDSWAKLDAVWEYLESAVLEGPWLRDARSLKVVPVLGRRYMAAAEDVVRLRGKTRGLSEGDRAFVEKHVKLVDPAWFRHVQRRRTSSNTRDGVRAFLARLDLGSPSSSQAIVDQLAASLFSSGRTARRDAVRVAHLSARLGVSGSSLHFVTRDGNLVTADDELVVDVDGLLDGLFPRSWADEHVLHADYGRLSKTCTPKEWRDWLASDRAPLELAPPLVETWEWYRRRGDVEREAKRRGHDRELEFPYRGSDFEVHEYDFPSELLEHWAAPRGDDELWPAILKSVCDAGNWTQALGSKFVQVASNGYRREIARGLPAEWIMRFRELPCLPDTHGNLRLPRELLRRTNATKPVNGIEPFVNGAFDQPQTRKLLDALGVGTRPADPGVILERIRALAGADNVPENELVKLYQRLDKLVATSTTEEFAQVKRVLRDEELILSADGEWRASGFVFILTSDEDAPGAPVVLHATRDLALWTRVGIPERPTAEHALTWLETLPQGERLRSGDAKRVRALLGRHPRRIWDDLERWLNLADEWVSADSLTYALTSEMRIDPRRFDDWVLASTADFRGLAREDVAEGPLASVPRLEPRLEWRLDGEPPHRTGTSQPWIEALGQELSSVELETSEETNHVRGTARRLARTRWVETPRLRVAPYVDGKPAGTASSRGAAWIGDALYALARSPGAVAEAVSSELSSAFDRPEIAKAIMLCFDRSADWVRDYVQENFTLGEPDLEPEHTVGHAGAGEAPSADSPRLGGGDGFEADGVDTDVEARLDLLVAGDEPGPDGTVTTVASRSRQRRGLVERYAASRGYVKEGDEFVRADGARIAHATGALFPWEEYDPSGELIARYWAKDHCLELKPLEIGADVWRLLEQDPKLRAILLVTRTGKPTVVAGTKLVRMKDNGTLRLTPATYRVRVAKA